MGSSVDNLNTSIDVMNKSKKLLIDALNIPRVILNDDDVSKDWKGLLHYIGGFNVQLPCSNPTEKVLEVWKTNAAETYNIESLRQYLERLERWDILDDIKNLLDEDIQFYIENKSKFQNKLGNNEICSEKKSITFRNGNFDAYVLYHDDDENQGLLVIHELESRGIRCCTTDRDLLISEFTHEAITTLISTRCSKLVIIVTESFINSNFFRYIQTYAHALGIEKGTEKLVPLRFDNCTLPASLQFYKMANFTKEDVFKNRWEQICSSIVPNSILIKTTQETSSIETVSHNMEVSKIVKPETSHGIDSRVLLDTAGSPPLNSATIQDEINRYQTSNNLISSTSNCPTNTYIINNQTSKSMDSIECQTHYGIRNGKKKKEKKISLVPRRIFKNIFGTRKPIAIME